MGGRDAIVRASVENSVSSNMGSVSLTLYGSINFSVSFIAIPYAPRKKEQL